MRSPRLFRRVPIARAVPLLALLVLGACSQVDIKQSVKAPLLGAAPDAVPVELAPLPPPVIASSITILPPRPVYVAPQPVFYVPPPRPVVFVQPPCPPQVVVVQPRPIVVVQPRPIVVVQPPRVVVLPAPEIDVPGYRAPGQWVPVTN
jgi:hypothetical protein